MATRHRHTDSEIAAKLHLAGEMAAQGRLHGAIAKSVKLSEMIELLHTLLHKAEI